MDVRVTSDPQTFGQTVFPFLQSDPVLHAMRTPGRGVYLGALRAELAQPVAEELSLGHREWAQRRLERGTLWIWEADGEPVSMVGYHSALTSRVTGRVLAEGNHACLYTDLANPTAIKIYHQAGCRPVAVQDPGSGYVFA
jgi:hypothetical protein